MKPDRIIETISKRKSDEIQNLDLFDANLWLGTPAFFPLAPSLTVDRLGILLRDFGIRGGLVSHWDAVHLSAQDGNQALIEASAGLGTMKHANTRKKR